MTNHVHLLLTPEDIVGPAHLMQAIGRHYVRYVNARYGRTGALWEGRFRSSVITSERYLFACYRYIEVNPLRAAMVSDPREYQWSSHRCNAYGEADELVTPHVLYRTLGSAAEARAEAYRGLFEHADDAATFHRIRRAASRGTTLGASDA